MSWRFGKLAVKKFIVDPLKRFIGCWLSGKLNLNVGKNKGLRRNMTEIVWLKRQGINIQVLKIDESLSGFVFVNGEASEFIKFNWE